MLGEAIRGGRIIYTCGNVGSAGIAGHLHYPAQHLRQQAMPAELMVKRVF